MDINMNNDKLNFIFKKQEELQIRVGNLPFKDEKHRQEFINLMFLSCLDELSESLRETAWKNPHFISCGWKKGQTTNDELFKEELVDLLHFFINLCIASGMDSNELFERYLNKNKINHERQNKGY